MRQVIAIVGGGFCGSLVAVHLLRQREKAVEVVLINEGYPVGQGVAYSAYSEVFLLNVHANRMSAFPDQPHHFVEWLLLRPEYATVSPEEVGSSFVPRKLYGLYLHELLEKALHHPAGENTCRVISQRAVHLAHAPLASAPFQLTLQDGQHIVAGQVVLALGNFKPPPLRCLLNAASLAPPLYYANPWKPEAWQQLPPRASLLLIGTGLTSIDIILDLISQGFKGTITAVSTNGFLPYPYQTASADAEFTQELSTATSLAEVLRMFRKARQAKGSAHWEQLINGGRSQTLRLWQRFSTEDKKRFYRQLGSLWAVARHRLPPQVHAQIRQAMKDQFLRIVSGHIMAITSDDGASVQVQVRGAKSKTVETFTADRVVNCTGPQLNYATLPDPLVDSLRQQELVSPHPLGMGLQTTDRFSVRRADGSVTPGLFTLGASLRGELWESNAVPELRVQAQDLAQQLLAGF